MLNNFLMEIEMYITINNKIYNTDKKIIFALLYIKKGIAVPWKQNFWTITKLDNIVTP